jgi:hypothetical protein
MLIVNAEPEVPYLQSPERRADLRPVDNPATGRKT